MPSTTLLNNPELLIPEDLQHFESVNQALKYDGGNVLIFSNDENTNSYIFNYLKNALESENNLLLYQHEKLEAFLADSLLGSFDTAFSKLNEKKDYKKISLQNILLLDDISKLDEREVDLLLNLNKHKKTKLNPIVIFFNNSLETNFDKSKLLNLFNNSIKWEPNRIIKRIEEQNSNLDPKFENKIIYKKNFLHSTWFFLGVLLICLITGFILIRPANFYEIKKYTYQSLNYIQLDQTPYIGNLIKKMYKKDSLTQKKEKNILEVEILNLSNLTQFMVARGYVIQYAAHLEIEDSLEWISKQKNIINPKLIKLKKNSDNSYFYAVVSEPFINHKEAINFMSNGTFSGTWWIRSLESIEVVQAPKNNRKKDF